LKVILLTGQRPGEVSHMRHEHIVDGWWTMPGEPDHKLGWPGTKNGQSHRVWLPEVVRDIMADIDGDSTTGFVFTTGSRGNPWASSLKPCAPSAPKSESTTRSRRTTCGARSRPG
jgi:hypothetical protein